LLELGADGFRFTPPFTWNDTERLHDELRAALRAFVLRLADSPGRPWAIAWCAGAGVVATSASALAAETANFGFFLQLLASEPALRARPGHVLLASSAGGVYGQSFACPISESTPPRRVRRTAARSWPRRSSCSPGPSANRRSAL